ncbi:MAG: F0F1 ATP synthase subunit B [Candidatus Marinimicrobia bacterium]|nr:F0F1 ATP synthase subunit B [Candidatus Neomarinimicrobiota bacterium]
MEQLVRFDPGLIFWTWVTFFVVLAILARKAWGPMIDALEKREAGIKAALAAADRAKAQAQEATVQYEQQLQDGRREAQQLVADARTIAEQLRGDLEKDARRQAEELLASARAQIAADRDRALRDIQATVVDLSVEIAGKVVERNLSTADNRKLAEDTLSRIGKA